MDASGQATVPGGGLLGRFENVRTKKSCKRIVTCEAATAEYLRNDYLKPQHLPLDRVDSEANFVAGSNINETRFHKGFHRRHKSDIQVDAPRLEMELQREMAREDRALASIAAAKGHKDSHTFNVLTGEGVGRENEFRSTGKRVLNPFGCMEDVFADHGKEASIRIKNSKHRFFETPVVQKPVRTANIFNEGLQETLRESAVIGYGRGGNRRTRSQSCGMADNYAHLRDLPPELAYEPPHYGNRSQIILG
mmetsp:Transcript_119768/g.298797  ORF Transcript_119768/g.298797 Transcript_119768/m.298797 type:complete len:250 (-) Transcript_119768:268-1017(-)